tara:strand:- start:42714 stop:43763 length:1050 start_codon:yes stop_codon:yes gene_type:complete
MKKIVLLLVLISNIAFSQVKQIPEDGITKIIALFKEKPLIAIGETHGHKQLYQFLTKLVQSEGFYKNVNAILIESGNALYQKTLDKYISGEDVPLSELQKVWMNTTQSPVDAWSVDVYYIFLKTIRELNNKNPKRYQIRVIAADPPIEWMNVNTNKEYITARGSRNKFYAKTAIEEVLNKKQKALLINGGAHFGYTNAKKVNGIIEKTHPNTVTVILATSGLGRANKAMEKKLRNWPKGTITKLKNTWIGKLPGPRRMVMRTSNQNSASTNPMPTTNSTKPKGTLKEDYADFLLYFGSIDEIEYGTIDAKIYRSNKVWKELNRRSLIRFNNKLTEKSRKTGELRPVAYN